MNRQLMGISIIVIVAVFLGSAWAYAQAPSIRVGFSFFAAGKELSSGKYAIEVTPAGHVVLRAEKGGATADITPLKSLGRSDSIQEPKLVFDIVGAERFLSEVWLAGQDGYLVGSVSGPHEEQVLGGHKSTK
jgi:hypothetical protein